MSGSQDVVFEGAATDDEVEIEKQVSVVDQVAAETGLAPLFSRLGKALLVGDDLATMLRQLLDTAFDVVPAQRGSICLFDSASGKFTPVVSRRGPAAAPISISRRVAETVVEQKRALFIADAIDGESFEASASIQEMNIKSVIAAPMYHNDVVQGLIYLDTVASEGGFLTPQFEAGHLDTLVAIAVFAAVCVERARLLERAKREEAQRMQVTDRVRVLLDVAKSLASELDTNSLIDKIMLNARGILNADRCTLFMLDTETEELWTKVADGDVTIRIPMNVGIAGEVATTGNVLNIPDAYQDSRFNPKIDKDTGYRTKSILCSPLRNNDGKIIGVTQMINKLDGKPFTKADEELLEAFSAQTAVCLENALLFQQTLEMSDYVRSVLESITNLVFTLDTTGRLVTANRPVQSFLGLDEATMKAQPYTEWFGGRNQIFVDDIKRVLRPGSKPIYVTDYELEATNLEISLNYNVVPLLDFEGTQKGVVLVIEDISHNKRVMSTLTRHLGSAVTQQLLDGGESRLGGVHQDATILFSDIRGYTSLTESLKAAEVVAMLNDYFSLMVDVIFAEDGVLDKYIGDAIMAVFGVPFPAPDDAARTCRAALTMSHALAEFNRHRTKSGQQPIRIGIGINSGDVISGNIGSEKRLEYTCIGDAVNLAARLEAASKTYGVQIVLNESTKNAIGEDFVTRELDVIRVKGKQQPSRIYELAGSRNHPVSGSRANAITCFDRGLRAYRQRDFASALASFEQACEHTEDGPAALFIQRCQLLKEQPPAEDWDGVWDMITK